MENKRMTVSEFVKKYNDMKSKRCSKESLWEEIRVLKYVPYAIKAKTAIEIIKDNFKLNNNMVLKNTPMLYVLNVMSMVTLYCPGLEISKDDALSDYDMLKRCGAIGEIVEVIGEDSAEYDKVFNMTYRDFIENVSSPQAYTNRLISVALQMLDGKFDSLMNELKNADMSKLFSSIPQSTEAE